MAHKLQRIKETNSTALEQQNKKSQQIPPPPPGEKKWGTFCPISYYRAIC